MPNYPRETYRVRSPQGNIREFSAGGMGDDLLRKLLAEGWVLLKAWPLESDEPAERQAPNPPKGWT